MIFKVDFLLIYYDSNIVIQNKIDFLLIFYSMANKISY